MICGIGIDCVLIERFAHWFQYSPKQLRKVYSDQELSYVFSNPKKQAERFAVRFAAKEACFKALSSVFPSVRLQFYFCLKYIEVRRKINCSVHLCIDYDKIFFQRLYTRKFFKSHISLSHDRLHAHAYVIIEDVTQ